ncbi:transcriptional regulator FilR1 domain-containing protein [Methanogenium organophilum]|uniref:DUF1724 domain-containing protein n=1 Tax=Methanogenium organophilum TaxID=2199 RepID=A0A9X9S4R1_METOG|nr:transcriptional regulator FilR1 domain-containing protein [Methanogenium organophilum]WAI01438.1 DUF1724 domain-containing protein [Methanogenium organophilum]
MISGEFLQTPYIVSNDLFSTDSPAPAWGERLFSYFRDLSEEFTII